MVIGIPVYHSNRYSMESACGFCHGIVYHEDWCITKNDNVHYAWEVVRDAEALLDDDRAYLKAVGIEWKNPQSTRRK